MHQGFWKTLATPIVGLSPMDGVTDQPFRYIQKKYGQPAVVYTEFTSVEGVCHGAERLLQDFYYDESQRPVVAQIYGTTPDFFRQSAILLCQLGFDGIDINMGCPAKNVAHSGAGAALIKTPELAKEIIRATKTGVQDWLNGQTAKDCQDITPNIVAKIEARHQQLPEAFQQKRALPVTVKTRVGYDQKIARDWAQILLEEEPVVIAMHGRTLNQHYSGEADWVEIGKAAEVVKQTETRFLGNGDVKSLEDALLKIDTYSLDGVLIGRASFGNPYIFKPSDYQPQTSIFEIALEHAQLFEQIYGEHPKYNFLPMRKHLGWYVRDIPYAREMRVELFKTNSSREVEAVLRNHNLLS